MREHVNIKDFLRDGPQDDCYNFFDWFCKDSSLKNRCTNLTTKLRQIADSPKIDIDKQYVFYKNCSPLGGSLYDQFSICDMITGDVLYCVVPKGEVWGKENDFKEPLIVGRWSEIKDWFNK